MEKWATSASYWNVKAVQDVLLQCDRIYSTNIGARSQLVELFGDRMIFYRGQLPLTEEELTRPDIELIGFSELRQLVRLALLKRDQQAANAIAEYYGWEATPVLLYDEEGIEGYEWTKRGCNDEFFSLVKNVPGDLIVKLSKTF